MFISQNTNLQNSFGRGDVASLHVVGIYTTAERRSTYSERLAWKPKVTVLDKRRKLHIYFNVIYWLPTLCVKRSR